MRATAYEKMRDSIAGSLGRARQLAADRKDSIVQALGELFAASLEHGSAEPGGMLASFPFAAAELAAKEVDVFSWLAFINHPVVQGLIDFDLKLGAITYKDQNLHTSWVSASMVNLWQHQCHAKAGERVYELSQGLGERLMHTELRGLTTEDLRLPYPNIYLVIPPELGMRIWNEVTHYHQLEGVYITECLDEHGARQWKLLFWGPANEKSEHEWDDSIFHFSVDLPAGRSLEEALDLTEGLRVKQSVSGTPSAQSFYKTNWRELFTLVLNTVIYVTWPDAEARAAQNPEYTRVAEQLKKHPKGSNKYERTREKLRTLPQQRRILLGESSKPFKGEASGPHGPLAVRTLVSGHWKRQAHGEGRALRKWIFVSPFWRGPEAAVESNPRRVLDAS